MIIRCDSIPAFDFGGLGIRDYTAGLSTTSSFAVISAPPGVSHAVSWSRRSDKYYYVVSGSIQFALAGDTHELEAGDFCLVSRGDRFSYRNEGEETATLCLFHTPSFDLDSDVFEAGPPLENRAGTPRARGRRVMSSDSAQTREP